MLIDSNGNRPDPGTIGFCGGCGGELVAKCGEIVIWHWAHKSGLDCDSWYEESEWHLGWKELFLSAGARCEVAMERDGKKHRADIVTPGGVVVEIQRSYLAPSEIVERENFYGSEMIWIFDVESAYRDDRLRIEKKPSKFGNGHYWAFHWYRPRTSLTYTSTVSILDFADNTIVVNKGIIASQLSGYGEVIPRRSVPWRAMKGQGSAPLPMAIWETRRLCLDDNGEIVSRLARRERVIEIAREDRFVEPATERIARAIEPVLDVFPGAFVVGTRSSRDPDE